MDKQIGCVMLIDDHHPTNVLHRLAIEDFASVKKIIVFDNGLDALTYLNKPFGIKHPKPDIIFLDINMPGMTGWDFLYNYKKLSEEIKMNISVIMLSTSSHPEDLAKAESETLVLEYLNKPLTKELMQNVEEEYFKRVKEKLIHRD